MSLKDEFPELDRIISTLRVVPVALMGGVSVFSVMATAMSREMEPKPMTGVYLGLFGFALVLVVAGLFVGRIMVRNHLEKISAGDDIDMVAQGYNAAKVVGWAISEGGGLLAAVLILVTGSWQFGLPIAIASVFAIVMSPVKREELQELLRRARS